MEFTEAQERIFAIFDDLVDADVDVFAEISSNVALRRRIGRNFTSVEGLSKSKSALHLYGFTEMGLLRYTPSKADLDNCFEIDDKYKVVFDEEFAQHIANVTGNSISEIRSLTHGDIKKQWELDALGEFVRDHDDDFLSLYQSYRDHNHIRYYFRCHFGKVREFRKAFGIDFRLHPWNSRTGVASAIQDGFRFEALVKRCFDAVGTEIRTDCRIDNCRPDFVAADSHWLDAKLSKSTSFSGSETIEKYTKHADFLTLIYAIDDMPDDRVPDIDDNVSLVHVLDYFEDLPDDLAAEIQRFIDDVITRRKEAKS